MAKLTLTDIETLTNEASAVSVMKANNNAIEAALENTLSRDGTQPNTMNETLDMNSYPIINLPNPPTLESPLRLKDLNDFIGGGVVSSLPSGGSTGQVLTKSSGSDYAADWETQPAKQVTYVQTMSDLRALTGSVTFNVFMNSYFTPTTALPASGGGYFYWDAASVLADDAGTIIQPNSLPSAGRWRRILPVPGEYNVRWFGAVGDGITTTDGDAILKTVHAAGPNGATIIIPRGFYLSSINCFPFVDYYGVHVKGDSASNSAFLSGSQVIFTSATGNLMTLDGVEGVEISNITFLYNNPAFAGDLIDARQIHGGIETCSVHIHDFTFSGTPSVAVNANSLFRVGQGIKFHVHDGFMQCAARGFHCAGDQSVNDVDIHDVWFQNFSTIPITMGGNNWNIHDNSIEPLVSGNAGFIIGTTRNYGCNVSCNNCADAATSAGTWLDFTGAGLIEGGSICNNLFDRGGVAINLGSSKGVLISGNYMGGVGLTDGIVIGASATAITCLSNYRVSSAGAGIGVVFNGARPADANSVIDNNDAFGIYVGSLRLTTALNVASGGFGTDVSGSSGVPIFTTGVVAFQGTTGTGNVVRATSPVLVTPALGTPASGVATNLTGTAAGLTAGSVTTNANLTGDVTSVGNATTLTNAPVIAKVLTGYTSGAGVVSATDSILAAIQKLNGNDATNANLTGDVTSVGNATTLTNAPVIAKVLTGYTSGAGTVSATDSILAAIQKLNGNDATNANLTGDVTSVGNATTLTNAPVIAKVLTGYTSGAGTVSAADSILSAIQKLNGNDATNANLTGDVTSVGNATTLTNAPVIAKVLTGYTAAVGTVAATDTILQAFNKVGALVDNAAWTSYTPTVTSQGGSLGTNPTNYTSTGLYKIIGKTMHIQCSVNVVNLTGSPTGVLFFTPPGGVTLTGNQALAATQNAGTSNGGIISTGGFGQFFVLAPASGTIIVTTYYIGGTIPIV